jgi:hypothetical protein
MNEHSAWLPLARLDDANRIACHSQDAGIDYAMRLAGP